MGKILLSSSAFVIFSVLLTGCTCTEVHPLAASSNVQHVYLLDNPNNRTEDLVQVIRDGFDRHGISSEIIPPHYKTDGKFVVTYASTRSWDLGSYLSSADIYIKKDGEEMGRAKYYLLADGGISLFKFQGTKTKIDPVMDRLLKNFPVQKKAE